MFLYRSQAAFLPETKYIGDLRQLYSMSSRRSRRARWPAPRREAPTTPAYAICTVTVARICHDFSLDDLVYFPRICGVSCGSVGRERVSGHYARDTLLRLIRWLDN